LCRSVLGWEVEKEATKTGKFIRGLRLRIVGMDDHIPTHDYTLAQRINTGDGSGDGTGDGTGDGSQSLINKDFDAGDGTIPDLIEEKIDNQKLDLLKGEIDLERPDNQKVLPENQPQESPKISVPSPVNHSKGFAPSQSPSQGQSQPPSPPTVSTVTQSITVTDKELVEPTLMALEVGDKAVYQGVEGEIVGTIGINYFIDLSDRTIMVTPDDLQRL
jgi:putative DNA primase/helicase